MDVAQKLYKKKLEKEQTGKFMDEIISVMIEKKESYSVNFIELILIFRLKKRLLIYIRKNMI